MLKRREDSLKVGDLGEYRIDRFADSREALILKHGHRDSSEIRDISELIQAGVKNAGFIIAAPVAAIAAAAEIQDGRRPSKLGLVAPMVEVFWQLEAQVFIQKRCLYVLSVVRFNRSIDSAERLHVEEAVERGL
ncbi:hypothetical protein OMP38_08995 [Cohnella ginsengisoli]|uniref:Uncharacterized protein n=1 Tax=Cohnella ginsengisoli TaxID=425004 RepID=A0A9X4KF70_9BACL|nr:hypothetical protein [Cohnella ginsengisoli]MDG0790988.1 hypothetical protein [Cohnella ginsengisoli]